MKAKRILTAMLAAALMLTSLSICANAQKAEKQTEIEENKGTLTDEEAHPLSFDAEDVEYGDVIYYGGIPWTVLDNKFPTGSDNETGIYLLSNYVYGYGTFWNAHYGPGDYVWNRTGIFTRLDVQHHPDGYKGDASNTSPTNLGYQESDIRKYMTGIGDYEAVWPRSMHEHGNPDNSGLNVSSYFWKTKVDYDTPEENVEYYIKGEFKLSDHEFNNYKTLAVTADDWLPDTWYVKDEEIGEYTLVEEAPGEGETLICYHDATEYYKVGELDSFEEGVDYYTFEKISSGMPEWEYTKLEMQANSIAKGALYCAFSVTDMKESTSEDTEGEGRVILSGENNRSFAFDMGFSELEMTAVLPVDRSGATNGGAKAPSLWTYKNSGAYSDEFVGDTYFLPTAADLNTYLDDKGISKAATFANGDPAQYWLSSMLRYDRVGMVDSNGGEWYQHPTFKSLGIRPAFVLDPEAVALLVPVQATEAVLLDEENTSSRVYKLILKDDDFEYTAIDFSAELVEISLDTAIFEYTVDEIGKNDHISAILVDATGNIVAYGMADSNGKKEGTIEFDVSGVEDIYGLTFYAFVESGAGEGYETGYTGGFVKLNETVEAANEIAVEFEAVPAEKRGELIYNINLVSKDVDIINRLNSVDLTFALTQISGTNEYEIISSNDEIAINPVNNSKNRYDFHYKNKDAATNTDTATSITIGQVKFTGYGKFSFAVDTAANATNAAHATTIYDNIVDTFVPGGVLEDGTEVGEFDVADDTITEVEIFAPTQKLTIKVAFPNAIENNVLAYQDMNVTVTGEDIEDISIDLGTDNTGAELTLTNKTDAAYTVAFDEASSVYTVVLENALTANTAYTVTVSGAGYRTARYTVNTQETDKVLNFWNNVKDNALEVEEGKATSAKTVTYLAGDIVKDSVINIYDLSAVVSYFGEEMDTDEYNAYAKYDLNRDGKIDSKDVAYVLVSWGK